MEFISYQYAKTNEFSHLRFGAIYCANTSRDLEIISFYINTFVCVYEKNYLTV